VCLMFQLCDKGGGGAGKYADVPGYNAQLVLSVLVPKRWQARVEEGFVQLVGHMQKDIAFPDVLRGQLKLATDDPLGMNLPYAAYEAMLHTKSKTQLRSILKAFKGLGSKSIERISLCQRVLDEMDSE
jgi:hypothetical protein